MSGTIDWYKVIHAISSSTGVLVQQLALLRWRVTFATVSTTLAAAAEVNTTVCTDHTTNTTATKRR
jgi:hypothetical protein